MKFSRAIVAGAITLAAVATTTMSATTASAAPAALFAGSVSGVGFSMNVKGGVVVASISGATFSLAPDHSSVQVLNKAGRSVAVIPLAYQVAKRTYTIAPKLASSRTSLTLLPTRPAAAAVANPFRVPVAAPGAQARFIKELNRSSFGAGVGAAIGAGIGLALGCVIGVFVGCIPGVLIGAGVGALVGLAQQGGPALGRAAFAYFLG